MTIEQQTVVVVSVEKLELDEPVTVGDIEIDSDEHSFRLSCEVTVHNSNICLSLQGTRYPDLISARIPPLHKRCRSVLIPVLKGEIDPTIPLSGAAWLETQSADTQDEVLGKAKGAAFRAGELEVEPGSLTHADGTPYTIPELRQQGVEI